MRRKPVKDETKSERTVNVIRRRTANGLSCRDLPRKISFGNYTDDDIDDVIWNINSTPRKCLGYRTPIETFAVNLGVALEM